MNLVILIQSGIILFFIIVLFFQIKNHRKALEENKKVFLISNRLHQILNENLDFKQVVQKIADAIPKELSFGTGVLSILEGDKLKRIAASKTMEAEQAIDLLVKMGIPFHTIEISIYDQNNLMAKALRENKRYITNDVYDVLGPVVSRDQALQIQNVMHTKTTFVYPIFLQNKPLGVFITSTGKTQMQLSDSEMEIINMFVNSMGFSLQNSRLFSSLEIASKKLESANRQLHELDQLKDDFVSITSHELRTPMTAIRSYAWMVLNRPDAALSEKMKKYMVRILISAGRLINLVNDMLNISRIESGRIEISPEPIDLIVLCRDIVDEIYYSKSTTKNVHFHLLEQTIPKVFADPNKLRQVFLNIMGNALKFSPPAGNITIGFFTDGVTVETYIKDEGPGIAQQDRGRLFTKFGRLDNSYTASAASGGTGLGLYISKALIDLMHGKIWVESEGLGKGATFKFSLPIATEEVLKHADEYKVKPHGEVKELEPAAI